MVAQEGLSVVLYSEARGQTVHLPFQSSKEHLTNKKLFFRQALLKTAGDFPLPAVSTGCSLALHVSLAQNKSWWAQQVPREPFLGTHLSEHSWVVGLCCSSILHEVQKVWGRFFFPVGL